MPKPKTPATSPRKKPKQERSAQLVQAILSAAVRVLERDGAPGFTTSKVARRAGVSVGSLYQYFPNKASILYRLQTDEWRETGELLEAILADTSQPASLRLRAAVRAFYHSEVAEAPLRGALGDAAPLYRDATESETQRNRAPALVSAALKEIVPRLGARRRAFAAELFVATMSGLGKHVSETQRSSAEVDAWALATADMFLAYVRQLEQG